MPRNPSGKILVTMALPYANGDIHLGHLLEAVQTDIFVRYQRLRGNETVYVSADDTHGTPIELSALKRGISPSELIAQAHKDHVRDYAAFNIGFDIFYSTDSEENRKYAELIYENLRKNGLSARSTSITADTTGASSRTASLPEHALNAKLKNSTATCARSAAPPTIRPTSATRAAPSAANGLP